MSDKLKKITTEHLMNPHGHGETLLRETAEAEVFAEFHNPYISEHRISQEEADELKIEAARKMLEEAPVSPEMQSRNNIDRVGEVALIRAQAVLAQEKNFYSDPTLSSKDIVKPN